ncbi:MAG: hypothetical protein NT010_08745 [Proteobacteria bacterium]|nr:hypothetical protein [Pseudomonadota bacterium]
MGKKTVPIADQRIPRRKVHIRIKSVIGALPVAGNFKTIPGKDR